MPAQPVCARSCQLRHPSGGRIAPLMPDTIGSGTGPTEYFHRGARYGIQRSNVLSGLHGLFHSQAELVTVLGMHYVQEAFQVQLSVQGKPKNSLVFSVVQMWPESISRCQRCALAESAARLSRSSNSVRNVSIDSCIFQSRWPQSPSLVFKTNTNAPNIFAPHPPLPPKRGGLGRE